MRIHPQLILDVPALAARGRNTLSNGQASQQGRLIAGTIDHLGTMQVEKQAALRRHLLPSSTLYRCASVSDDNPCTCNDTARSHHSSCTAAVAPLESHVLGVISGISLATNVDFSCTSGSRPCVRIKLRTFRCDYFARSHLACDREPAACAPPISLCCLTGLRPTLERVFV